VVTCRASLWSHVPAAPGHMLSGIHRARPILDFADDGMDTSCISSHRSDSGGASFLGQVWAAMREWRDSGEFQLESIPRLELQVGASQVLLVLLLLLHALH
jgi:hypothetical protein